MTRRILYVVTTLGWGGAESQVIDLASRFHTRGWDVGVATLLAEAERSAPLRALGISVHTLGMRRGVPDPRALARLARLIASFGPSVVHAHMVHANLLTRLVRLFCRMPVLICSAHIDEEGRWREMAYRLTDSLTDLTTNVSHAGVQRAIAVGAAPEHRIRFMANGIDVCRFGGDTSACASLRHELSLGDRFVWLAVARFDEQKDYPNLLKAYAQVCDHPAHPILLLVGEGPLKPQMESHARHAGLTRSVRFLGRRDDIPDLMKAADAYVMSSAWEGLPIVLLEAAASRLPIVATDVGGNSQIVLKGKTGELVLPRASRALGDAMRRMMDLPAEERIALGDAGSRHVAETFGLDTIVGQWEDVYVDLLSGKGA